MRLSKSLAIAASALALAAGAAFAGEAYRPHRAGRTELLSDAESSPGGMLHGSPEYLPQAPEYEVYEVYIVPAEIVLIPLDRAGATNSRRRAGLSRA